MGKDNKNGILCLFALACVAILLSTSMIVLTGNDTVSDVAQTSCTRENLHYDSDGYLVGESDDGDCVGEKALESQATGMVGVNIDFWCDDLAYETHSGNTLWVTDYAHGYRHIVVPDKVIHDGQEWTVTKIDRWGLTTRSFFGTHPNTIEIGPTVEVLGEHCFSDEFSTDNTLYKFTIRNLDQSVLREIEDEAFYDTGIESIELPQSLTLIRQKAFKSCDYLENVTLHSVTLDIHKEAFYNDDKLKSINLNNVRYIGVEALYNTKVTDLDLSSAEHVEKYAYVGGSLHSVKFSHNLVMLHDKAFVTKDMVIFPNEYYHFFDTHHTEMGQCAELMHGKTFVRGEGKTLVQVL